jgi:hypothetical protein
MRMFAFFTAVGLLTAATAFGGECGAAPPTCGVAACEAGCVGHRCGCCPHCGCPMVCQTIRMTREVKKTVWVVHCEPFCAPLPGRGRHCETCQGPCGEQGCHEAACGEHGDRCDRCAVEQAKRQVPPKCGKVHCKKTLEKKEVVCKVPTYKCVPTCPHCGCGTPNCGAAAPSTHIEKARLPAPAPGRAT